MFMDRVKLNTIESNVSVENVKTVIQAMKVISNVSIAVKRALKSYMQCEAESRLRLSLTFALDKAINTMS